jgi:hypothetical protein
MHRVIVILTLVMVRRKGDLGDFFLDEVRGTEAGYGSGVIVWFARGRHGGSDAAIVSVSSSLSSVGILDGEDGHPDRSLFAPSGGNG